MTDPAALLEAFDSEANFCATSSQIHSCNATCFKYAVRGKSLDQKTLCRFKAPWKEHPETHVTEDGILNIKRNHPLVNRWNPAMAIGLRHNHDISLICTKTKALAMMYYITNYATKLAQPMYARLSLAASVLEQMGGEDGSLPPNSHSVDGLSKEQLERYNPTRQFLMRAANMIFSDTELSSVEVCSHLLGYGTDFTNVRDWSYFHTNTLYWAVYRRWPHLRQLATGSSADSDYQLSVSVGKNGMKLPWFEAYANRSKVLADLCFYEYLCYVQ